MADSQDLIGQGMGIAMDEIWRMLFGNAFVNARQGQPITAGDVGDTAFTVGLNALPFGAGGVAAKGVQAADPAIARAIAINTLRKGRTAQVVPESALRQINADQQVKNAFQAGQKEIAWPNMKMIENRTLGIPMDAADDMRPIYQYLTTGRTIPESVLKVLPKQTREILRATNAKNPTATGLFGENAPRTIMFGGQKPGATFTAGDSAYMTRGANPLPMTPTKTAVERLLQSPKPAFFEVQTPPKTPLFQNMRNVR